jgi:hypothetical protein
MMQFYWKDKFGVEHLFRVVFKFHPLRGKIEFMKLRTEQMPILSTFYAKLLRLQISKAQKKIDLIVLLGSVHVKSASKMLVKSIPNQNTVLISNINIKPKYIDD